MWKLPEASSPGSSKCCPFQNISITPVLRAVKPTAGFSPTNQTGMPCHNFDVAWGSPASMAACNAWQRAARCGSCLAAYSVISAEGMWAPGRLLFGFRFLLLGFLLLGFLRSALRGRLLRGFLR